MLSLFMPRDIFLQTLLINLENTKSTLRPLPFGMGNQMISLNVVTLKLVFFICSVKAIIHMKIKLLIDCFLTKSKYS